MRATAYRRTKTRSCGTRSPGMADISSRSRADPAAAQGLRLLAVYRPHRTGHAGEYSLRLRIRLRDDLARAQEQHQLPNARRLVPLPDLLAKLHDGGRL